MIQAIKNLQLNTGDYNSLKNLFIIGNISKITIINKAILASILSIVLIGNNIINKYKAIKTPKPIKRSFIKVEVTHYTYTIYYSLCL